MSESKEDVKDNKKIIKELNEEFDASDNKEQFLNDLLDEVYAKD